MPEWVVDLAKWLVSPALVIASLWFFAQLYEPTLRWGRVLKRDEGITAGLSDGPEKEHWDRQNNQLAERLRNYRRAMTRKRTVGKIVALLYIGFTFAVTVIWPPVNKPGEKYPLGVADYYAMILALLQIAVVLTWISAGRSLSGRSIQEMLRADRVSRYRRRAKRLDRLDKIRSEVIATGVEIRPKGTRLGFTTQQDTMRHWVSTWEMRDVAASSGFHRSGGDDRARASLAKSAGHLSPTSIARELTTAAKGDRKRHKGS